MTAENRGTGKGSNQPSVEPMPGKGSVQYKELVTLKRGGDVFIRRLKIIKYRYQRVRWIYITQKGKLVRKLVVYGTLERKPRGMRWPA